MLENIKPYQFNHINKQSKTQSLTESNNKNSFSKSVLFKGILDNVNNQRVEGKDGHTYIVEPGGKLVVVNKKEQKDSKKGEVLAGVGGAGVGGIGAKVAGDKEQHTEEVKGHDITINPEGHTVEGHDSSTRHNLNNDIDNTEDLPDSSSLHPDLDDDINNVDNTEVFDDHDDSDIDDDINL